MSTMESIESSGKQSSAVDKSKVEVIVYTKSDKTLKNNMNGKDESLRKRTSLIIVPQMDAMTTAIAKPKTKPQPKPTLMLNDEQSTTLGKTTKTRTKCIVGDENNIDNDANNERSHMNVNNNDEDNTNIHPTSDTSNRNSIASMDSCVSTSTTSALSCHSSRSCSVSSSAGVGVDDVNSGGGNGDGGGGGIANVSIYHDLQNGNVHQNDDDDDDDVDGDDEETNVKSTPTSNICATLSSSLSLSTTSTSSTSSPSSCSVDYSLREQLENIANRDADVEAATKCADELPTAAQLLKGMQMSKSTVAPHCDTLLSPQEVPMGRRYAEVLQFKSVAKRTSELNASAAASANMVTLPASAAVTIKAKATVTKTQATSAGSVAHKAAAAAAAATTAAATLATQDPVNKSSNKSSSSAHQQPHKKKPEHKLQQQQQQQQQQSQHEQQKPRARAPFCVGDSLKGSDNNGGDPKDSCGGGPNGGNGKTRSPTVGNKNQSFEQCATQGQSSKSITKTITTTTATTSPGAGTATPVESQSVTKTGGDVSARVGSCAASQPFYHVHESLSNESSYCDDADDNDDNGDAFEDDMQALLPKYTRQSRDELSQSRTSLVSSSEGGILAEGETSSETSRDASDDESPPCDLGLVERLLLTHPVWFLPGIQRSGAVHFLQGKEEGNFIVRGSSQPNTMAVSVRLPPDTGPYIEHYLIQSNDSILSLESSRFKFDSIPALIAHYAQCCDELPVQLLLPRALREARNRQQLSSLALLGQEFWRYAVQQQSQQQQQQQLQLPPQQQRQQVMSVAVATTTALAVNGGLPVSGAALKSAAHVDMEAQLLEAKSPNSMTDTSGLGTATFFSDSNANAPSHGAAVAKSLALPPSGASVFSPTGSSNLLGGFFSQAGTPSDTTSSMSSFTTSGGQHMQLMSPESIDSIVLTMSPVDGSNSQRSGLLPCNAIGRPVIEMASTSLSTFKANAAASASGSGSGSGTATGASASASGNSNSSNGSDAGVCRPMFDQLVGNEVRAQRPKPPNTLNLDLNLHKPPAPPLRWSKPLSPHSAAGTAPSTLLPTQEHAVGQSGASSDGDVSGVGNNFTVTTTVTFSMDGNGKNSSPQFLEVSTPGTTNPFSGSDGSTTFQTFAKRLSPEGECKDTLSSQGSSSNDSRWTQSQSSRDSNNSQRKILPPASNAAATPTAGSCTAGLITIAGGGNSKSRKAKARKESKHYQESDILERPQIYCRSNLGDKISDYEDLWSHDPSDRTSLLTSFKPAAGMPTESFLQQSKRPDLLTETPSTSTPAMPTNLNAALLPIAGSNQHLDLASHVPNEPASGDLHLNPVIGGTVTHQLLQFSGDALPRSRAGLLLPLGMSQSLTDEQLQVKALPDAVNDASIGESAAGDVTLTAQTPVSRSKQGSPFYAEPADALRQAGVTSGNILRRTQRNQLLPANHRHSEPLKGGLVASVAACPTLAPTEMEKMAGSLDELKKQKLQAQAQSQAQAQQSSKRARNRFEHWQLDSSWEFMAKQAPEGQTPGSGCVSGTSAANYGDYDSTVDWQVDKQTRIQEKENSLGRGINHKDAKQRPLTVHQIIAKRLPDLNLPELVRCSTPQQQPMQQAQGSISGDNKQMLTNAAPLSALNELSGSQKSFRSQNGCRLSSYDNVERNYAAFCHTYFNGNDSAQSDDGTVFSEPWDSSQWDSFIPQDDMTINSETIHLSKCRPAVSEDDTIVEELSTTKDINSGNNQDTLKAYKSNSKACRPKVATILRNPSMRDREILCHPRNKINLYGSGPGDSLRAYTLQLAQDQSSTFARNIENFISCTKESREAAPQVVMRNMRQFMNGMKNYLVKHGEGKFHQEVEAARARLKSDEFLNLDAILETVMHQLVVLPLREHLYEMFVDYYKRSEDIQLLTQNVNYACGREPIDFGIRPSVMPPSVTSLLAISTLLLRLQEAELPLDKLQLFLCVISTIFDATGCPRGQQLGADDFLPVLVYVVAKCTFVSAEIEAEFMWGLLQPTLLNGEPGYYLTALCSAVHVLKSFMAAEGESGTSSLDWRSSQCIPACSSVLRVIIPDECNGSLQTRTLPVRPHTTTREVCRIIAHKARITNPQDYALFKLVDGEETLLTDAECPQDVRLAAKGKHCMLAYKRIDAKIAWPTATATPAAQQNCLN